MYSYEERLRAVKLYLKYGRRLKATIRELGYPTKNSLKAWCAEFEEGGNLQEKYVRSLSKYSDEQKNTAIEHYVNHGRCFAFTLRALGYPSRQKLSEWVGERYPETKKTVVGKVSKPAASLDSKRAAVYELCTREGSAQDVASKLDVARVTLYNWKNQLLGREAPASMKREKSPPSEPDRNDLELVRRLMKQGGHIAARPKRRRYRSYVGEISPAPENLINRDFQATAPNEKWLTDISEFHIPAGKAYLSPMIDCFDGMVVSWSIGTSPDAELVNTMLDAAIETVTESDDKPIVHSDRGGHYRWPGWLARVADAKLTRSMSRRACSPDNAACEGFFGRLKTEMFYPGDWRSTTIEQFVEVLDKYIRWYNEKRIKSSLGYLSPIEYRESLGITM